MTFGDLAGSKRLIVQDLNDKNHSRLWIFILTRFVCHQYERCKAVLTNMNKNGIDDSCNEK